MTSGHDWFQPYPSSEIWECKKCKTQILSSDRPDPKMLIDPKKLSCDDLCLQYVMEQ